MRDSPFFPWTEILRRFRIAREGEMRYRSGFVGEINDRFPFEGASRNLTSIYLIAVLLQARHCSVKSHPSFPLLSLPLFFPPFFHSHHPIFSARTRICATRRLLSAAKREPYCHLLVHNMSTRAFADGFVVEVGTGTREASVVIQTVLPD